jgi:molybdopterin-guanine dinucleotide biosynthesis protein A
MDSKPVEPLGVILAGGRGRRLGGNKPLRNLCGKRLIDRSLEIMARICPSYIVVTGDPADLPGLGCPVMGDIWPGLGPLGGLATAFLKTRAPWIQFLPVDAPLVDPGLLRLLPGRAKGQKAVAIRTPGGLEPLLALYSLDCLPPALKLLESGERRLRLLLETVGSLVVEWKEVSHLDPKGLSFLNVNRSEDLDRAEEILAGRQG